MRLELNQVRTISFSVDYSLAEYLSFTRDFGHQLILGDSGSAGKRTIGQRASTLLFNGAVAVLAPPIFLFKKHAVGACEFEISCAGIVRRSKAGEFSAPWSEVKAIHQLSKAYLVQIDKGAIPLPYRCFSNSERGEFEGMAGQLFPPHLPD
jgi:hypothetical protein